MKLERVILPIEPRTVGSCIDLALVLYRAHLAPILLLSALFAGPAAAAACSLAARDGGWLIVIALFLLGSPFLGAALVAGIGHRVFGESFTIRGSIGIVSKRAGALLVVSLLSRIAMAASGLLCLGVFTPLLAVRYGFFPEILLLERLSLGRADRRAAELLRGVFWEAAGRFLAVAGFGACAFLALFFLVDLGSGMLLGIPIFVGRVPSLLYFSEYVLLWFEDPLVVATWSSLLWLVYPPARLAWFLCYLDIRIRKEGWDLEIAFRLETRRLATT